MEDLNDLVRTERFTVHERRCDPVQGIFMHLKNLASLVVRLRDQEPDLTVNSRRNLIREILVPRVIPTEEDLTLRFSVLKRLRIPTDQPR